MKKKTKRRIIYKKLKFINKFLNLSYKINKNRIKIKHINRN